MGMALETKCTMMNACQKDKGYALFYSFILW